MQFHEKKSKIELSAKMKKKSWERTENELGMREIVLDIPNDAEYFTIQVTLHSQIPGIWV